MIAVILIKSQTPENIGFIARSMANFDLNKLVLVAPECNHLEEGAKKTSKHAKNILEDAEIREYTYFYDLELKKDYDLVIGTTSVIGSDYNIRRTPLSLEDFTEKIDQKKKIAVVFGHSGTGLNNDEVKKCDFLVTIPSSKNYPALNISHAAAIVFYEIFKKIGKEKINSHINPASVKDREIIMEKLSNILNNLEFQTEEKKQTQLITWKRIFEQSMMSKREAFAVLGLLSKLEKD